MLEDPSPEGLVSESDLVRLTDLFREVEGAGDPRSLGLREAEAEFNSLVRAIYEERVVPNFQSLTFSQFKSYTRLQCRLRIRKEGPPFPCV